MRFDLRPFTTAAFVAGLLGLVAAPGLAQTRNPDREAYFGETHVHTSWSLDAVPTAPTGLQRAELGGCAPSSARRTRTRSVACSSGRS